MLKFNSAYFTLVLFLESLDLFSCEVHYIVPSQSYPCSEDSCLTLSQFANNSINYIDSNTTLLIIGGSHVLDRGISVLNIEGFSMLSGNDTNSVVTCSERANFSFSDVGHVYISGLTFVGCSNGFNSVNQLTIEHSMFLGQNKGETSVVISETNGNMAETYFLSNTVGRCQQDIRFFRYLQTVITSNYPQSSCTVRVGGALIVSHSNLTVDNCQFEGNGANIGGAIFSEFESNMSISNSEFTSNQATGCGNELCFGGALFIDGTGSVNITNTTFQNNTSDQDGGMAVVFNATLSVSQSHAYNNTAARHGGAVAIFHSSRLVLETTTFNCSRASLDGGAVYAKLDSNVSVNNSTFFNNSATNHGGVLFIQTECSITVNGSNILNNVAQKSGGVIHATNNTITTVSNSKLSYNKAKRDGGVVLLIENSTTMIIDSTFSHNMAERGGVIFVREPGSSFVISSSSFSSNHANLHGGVVHSLYSGDLLVSGSTFVHNSAGLEGGVLYGFYVQNIEVHGSTFVTNKANIGGVFTIRNSSNFFTEESVYFNNTNSDLGAVMYADNGTDSIIHHCYFTQNSASNGGVLHVTRKSSVTINNSTFDNNIATIGGGALYGRAQCRVTISNSSFRNNTAGNDGVMLAFDGSVITLDDSTFSDNIAGHDGGALHVYDKSTSIINNCTFTNNKANNSGGSVYIRKQSTVTISNSIVHNSTAQNSGGGVYAQEDSNVTIEASKFTYNTAYYGGSVHVYIRSAAYISKCNFSKNKGNNAGGVMAAYMSSTITVQSSNFTFNTANVGAVLVVYQTTFLEFDDDDSLNNATEFGGVTNVLIRSTVTFIGCTIKHSVADYGGAVYALGSNVTSHASSFYHNHARYIGGVIYATNDCQVSILDASMFSNNTAEDDGGMMALIGKSVMTVRNSGFTGNRAYVSGGVVTLKESSFSVTNSSFNFSTTDNGNGGVVLATSSSVSIDKSLFTGNNVKEKGGVVYAHVTSSLMVLSSKFFKNAAKKGGALYVSENSSCIIVDSIFEHNKAEGDGGVLLASDSSHVNISGGKFNQNTAAEMGAGAALAAVDYSSLSFDSFLCNECQEIANEETQIHNNTAQVSGGGIYLNRSKVYFEVETNISHNQAHAFGGGVHAIHSSIIMRGTVHFGSNIATSGGGISLTNSTLYDMIGEGMMYDVNFTSNQADHGGAMYVEDGESATCSSTGAYPFDGSGCFFQTVDKRLVINFNNNYANISGNDLFGGLLDRCTVVNYTNHSKLEPLSGAARFEEISNIRNFDTVSSGPVRVCLCKHNEPDCSQHTHSIQVKQGNAFNISVAAVDQVNQMVSSTIQSKFNNLDNALAESQTVQKVGENCSILEYQVSFPSVPKEYELNLFADGPCKDKGISIFSIGVNVLRCSCPPGFMRSKANPACVCICDRQDETFSRYIQDCNSSTESVIRKGQFWISYLNDSGSDDDHLSPYLIYPYCPLDYCQPSSKSVSINFNSPNGEDAQCANNRTGILCGSCLSDYSLSLGSSKCIKCPDNWYGLLIGIIIAAFFAGIVLVVLILVLNLTVAVGTLNSVIFYANIIYANRSVYFGRSYLSFVPVFISWLNLDIGFDVCFFEGMDAYAKTWLQLAFPVYIIFLVMMIIFISSCSSKFSNLLGKRNPVPTLATLILLSYTQLLETIITSLALVPVKYPNGTTLMKWLPDASVDYSEWKHIVLICVAFLILVFGLLYTILILSWQWLLHCSRSKLFKWTRNQKLHSFIDTYHTPHTAKHRYWTGLLLLVRVIVYIISAFSLSIDPRIAYLSTVTIMYCLFLYKTMLMVRVYKNWLLSAMESFVFFNIAILASITLYTFDDSENPSKSKEILQTFAVYISVGTIVILFLFVIIFHVYRYGSVKIYSFGQTTKLGRKAHNIMLYDQNQDYKNPTESTLLDVIDSPREGRNYKPPPLQGSTSSVVSMTDCCEASTVESPQAQDESSNSTATHGYGNRIKLRSETLNFKTRIAEFEVTGKTKRNLLFFRSQGASNKNITKALLEEDQL